MITIYCARRILTMNPARPEATHVAVREGRIVGAGSLEELAGWGRHELDERFAGKVLIPGLVEGHSHAMEGTFWRYVYVGYFDRMDPDGKTWPGAKSIDAVIARLREASEALKDPAAPLSGWGLDPIYFGERRVSRADLDRVSASRPVGVLHASGHILNANTKALELGARREAGRLHLHACRHPERRHLDPDRREDVARGSVTTDEEQQVHAAAGSMGESLAREVGLAGSALHERFVQYLGHPPMQYLANWRIQLGTRLLRESNRNVATIALDVGYESEASFSRAFKRLVGMPPAAWRRTQTRA